MARVFVSYTSEMTRFPSDESFAAAAVNGITEAGHVAVHMKQFTAEPAPPADVCREAVRTCDAFVGLIGFRFGTPVRSEDVRSYTELEFDEAVATGIPLLIFLLDQADPSNLGRSIDLDRPDLLVRQLAFRRRLQDGADITTVTFRAPEELQTLVRRAVEKVRSLSGMVPVRSGGSGKAIGLPTPTRCVGREDLRSQVVASLTETRSSRVALLGGPGIGKSTVAVSALHDAGVAIRFGSRRWFVRCDGARSGDAFLTAIAVETGTAGEAGLDLRRRVLQTLGGAEALLILDNLETPWISDTMGTEELLRSITGACPGLSVLTTIRGTGWPAGIDWTEVLVVPPLENDAATETFLAVAGKKFSTDPDLVRLIGQMDGVPLAVELLAYNAQGYPDLSELLERWRIDRAALLARGAANRRELSVPLSVEMSVQSPTMTAEGRRAISVLGLLPDGISRSMVDEVMPGFGLAGAAALRRAGLVFDSHGRLRLLTPVREHIVANYPPEEADESRLVGTYCRLGASLGLQIGRAGGGEAASVMAQEVNNIHTVIGRALSAGQNHLAIEAATGLAELQRLTGVVVTGTLEMIDASIATEDALLHARLLVALAGVAVKRLDHESAERLYRQALGVYQSSDNVAGRAQCLQGLGHVALVVGDCGGAKSLYREALAVFEGIPDVQGMARSVLGLADAKLWENSDYSGAKDSYERALELLSSSGDKLGQANCLRSLGDIDIVNHDLEGARRSFDLAMPMFEAVGSLLGMANCIQGMADVALELGDLAGARDSYLMALPMFKNFEDVLGEANCIQGLADASLASGNIDAARIDLDRSLIMFEKTGDLLGQGNCHQAIGEIESLRRNPEKARHSFLEALDCYQQVAEARSISQTHRRLALLSAAFPPNSEASGSRPEDQAASEALEELVAGIVFSSPSADRAGIRPRVRRRRRR